MRFKEGAGIKKGARMRFKEGAGIKKGASEMQQQLPQRREREGGKKKNIRKAAGPVHPLWPLQCPVVLPPCPLSL